MKTNATGKPDVAKREVEIVNFLKAKKGEGVVASEIYVTVADELGDTISRPAYYKILDRLVSAGKIERVVESGVNHYYLPRKMHSASPLTLDDVRELLPFVDSTESVARAVEAQEYFLQNRDKAVREAAQALAEENAPKLVFKWLNSLIDTLKHDLELYGYEEKKVYVLKDDTRLEGRIEAQVRLLRDLLYRQLSIPAWVVDVPEWRGAGATSLKERVITSKDLHYDPAALKRLLHERIVGVGPDDTVLGPITFSVEEEFAAEQEMIVGGSDGSFYVGALNIQRAGGFEENENFRVTFNNGVAFVRSSAKVEQQRGPKKFIHSVPVNREAMDSPDNKGMVLARFMYPTLTDSEYEHMTRTAADVVQMRVDEAVIRGTATDILTREAILPPRVQIRDGTITPQDRGYNHYRSPKPDGEIVREGIRLSRSILEHIRTSRGSPRLYAGAVKSTQVKFFSRLISWYIAQGSKDKLGEAIDPSWDGAQSNFISDVTAMTILLSSLEKPERGFWVSCVVIRQFASLTDFYSLKVDVDDPLGWFSHLKGLRSRKLEEFASLGGDLTYDAIRSEDDLADDDYLYLLEQADYASFYVGHSGGDARATVPRYEFLTSLRALDKDAVRERVCRAQAQLVLALQICRFTVDRDHNFLSRLTLVKVVVSVVYRAHEFAKTLGRKFEQEFKSLVVRRLAELTNVSAKDPDFIPEGVERYLKRLKRLGGGGDDIV